MLYFLLVLEYCESIFHSTCIFLCMNDLLINSRLLARTYLHSYSSRVLFSLSRCTSGVTYDFEDSRRSALTTSDIVKFLVCEQISAFFSCKRRQPFLCRRNTRPKKLEVTKNSFLDNSVFAKVGIMGIGRNKSTNYFIGLNFFRNNKIIF